MNKTCIIGYWSVNNNAIFNCLCNFNFEQSRKWLSLRWAGKILSMIVNKHNKCVKKKKSGVTHTYAPPPLTVKTYVKKRDLKLDSQLTEIDKNKEGQIAGGGWRRRGSSGNLLLTSYDTRAESCKIKKLKSLTRAVAREKQGNIICAAAFIRRRRHTVKVLDGRHAGCAPILQLLLRPRSHQWHHESKCWVHSTHVSLGQ